MTALPASPRALVAGWFSFAEVIATVGDQLGARATAAWLAEAGWDVDVAVAPYMGEGVDWRRVDPGGYDLLVFTTGPLTDTPVLHELLDRFADCPAWALNVSPLGERILTRFDRIWPRDGGAQPGPVTHADIAAAVAGPSLTPVVGVAYAPEQPEYDGGRHGDVRATVSGWLRESRLARVELDMDMYAEHRFPREPAQIEALIERTDVVVSMRLHAAVLALALGRPVIAVDAIADGGKVSQQMSHVGWPCVLRPGELSASALNDALAWCRSELAVKQVEQSRHLALDDVAALGGEVRDAARRQRATALPEAP
jgi:hypothetical protein